MSEIDQKINEIIMQHAVLAAVSTNEPAYTISLLRTEQATGSSFVFKYECGDYSRKSTDTHWTMTAGLEAASDVLQHLSARIKECKKLVKETSNRFCALPNFHYINADSIDIDELARFIVGDWSSKYAAVLATGKGTRLTGYGCYTFYLRRSSPGVSLVKISKDWNLLSDEAKQAWTVVADDVQQWVAVCVAKTSTQASASIK